MSLKLYLQSVRADIGHPRLSIDYLLSLLTARRPSTSNPSSVNVPVLSKQTTSNLPPTLTLTQLARIIQSLASVGIPLRTDTVYLLLFQPRYSEICSYGQSGRKSRWDDDSDEIQSSHDNSVPRKLQELDDVKHGDSPPD